MRVRPDLDQKRLAELLHEYIEVEEDFVTALFAGETQFSRVLPSEQALAREPSLHVLDHERASRIVEEAWEISVGMCSCRHREQHLGRGCAAPMDTCLTFNTIAASLNKHGVSKPADKVQALEILARAAEQDLVQIAENVQTGVGFLCNCCACCCGTLKSVRRFGFLHPVHSTSYEPAIDEARCRGCGRCVNACPVEALHLVSANLPDRKQRKARLRAEACLGCGLCVRKCRHGAMRLVARAERVIVPLTSTHRIVLMAIERGKLHDLLFDDRALASHRALAAILGVILALPPAKQALASRQLRSRYLERLLGR
jgi:ferredoxin